MVEDDPIFAQILVEAAREHGLKAVAALRERYVQYREMALEERPVIACDVTAVPIWGEMSA